MLRFFSGSLARWSAVFFMMLLAAPAARAASITLLDLTNTIEGATPYILPFVATSNSTTISIEGYEVPSYEYSSSNGLFLAGSPTNLLGGIWSYTPAEFGSLSSTFNDGSSVPGIVFGAVVVGDYDSYSQTVATTVGKSYSVELDYSNPGSPSGFLVTATNASVASSTPLPGSANAGIVLFALVGLLCWRKSNQRITA
jgi:hypothetical protein